MSTPLLLVPLVGLASAATFYVWLRRKNLGTLAVTTQDVAFDHDAFGHILTWDKHCLYIHGKPIMILSGEFHYWRLPDRSRWEIILKQYKAAGLNTIRIYFHWGYHSPQEGIYIFDDRRDVDYLLTLCETLELFVMAAPGPYICAETQAGGLPIWLASKRYIRLRHSVNSVYRSYDTEYSRYCEEWYRALIPQMVTHQITYKRHGCLIAVQIENEAFELFKGIPLGLADDMRHLCKVARDCGITVPFFTNDAWEEGSFVTRPPGHTSLSKPTFGIDLFGFDKYIVFCPTSAPLATLSGSNDEKTSWDDWAPRDVLNGIDGMEKRVRAIGGGAAKSPIFIPELQGGWFNHYTVKHSYDDIYNYYGESYTKLVLDSVLGQGVTMLSYYMFYGGTNWGTIGDPDVYTSYDYSACIREMGHLSGRARKLRLGLSFARSFAPLLARTNVAEPRDSSIISKFCAARRISCQDSKTQFLFLRNFSSTKSETEKVTVKSPKLGHFDLPIRLPYKQSSICLSNYTVGDSLHLALSTIPIYLRTRADVNGRSTEIWIVQCDDLFNGSLAFSGKVYTSSGTLNPTVSLMNEGKLSVVSWDAFEGWMALGQTENQTDLYILSLSYSDLYTLQPYFRETFWAEDQSPEIPLTVMWGTYGAHFNVKTGMVHIERTLIESSTKLYVLGSENRSWPGFGSISSGPFSGVPFLYVKELSSEIVSLEVKSYVLPVAKDWKQRILDFNTFDWEKLPMKNATTPGKNTIDYAFTSGHVFYKLRFTKPNNLTQDLKFNVNLRHRGTVYLNDRFVSTHIVYSLGVFRSGSKNGPDNTFRGWKCITLPRALLKDGENILVVMVESFGLNRQPFSFNDIRCPRGIIEASIPGISGITWEICGVDVRELNEAYNISGVPDQFSMTGYAPFKNVSLENGGVSLDFKGLNKPSWFTSVFEAPSYDQTNRVPLRLCMSGSATAYVSINGIMIARYYGNGDGPQSDFYIPDGLLKSHKNTIQIIGYRTETDDSRLGISFKFWNFSRSDPWSGNLDDSSDLPLVIINEGIKIRG